MSRCSCPCRRRRCWCSAALAPRAIPLRQPRLRATERSSAHPNAQDLVDPPRTGATHEIHLFFDVVSGRLFMDQSAGRVIAAGSVVAPDHVNSSLSWIGDGGSNGVSYV